MKTLETISEIIAKIKQATGNSNLGERTSLVDGIADASEQELQAAQQAQIAAANAVYEKGLQEAQKLAQDTKTFITSADVIANALQTSAQNELIDMNALTTSVSNLQTAGFDLSDKQTIQKLFSAEICGLKDMKIDTEAQLTKAIETAEETNHQILKAAAIAQICEDYELITCAENKGEYIALTEASLKAVEKTAAEFNISEGKVYQEAEKLEVSDDAKANGAYLRTLQSVKEAYVTAKSPKTATTGIATIDNIVSALAQSGYTLNADDIIALTLSEHGINTQCQFDAKAKFLICDADTGRIFNELVSLKAPKERQITTDEVDSFRKIDLSTARLKAAGVTDENCAEIQKQAQGLLSTFTSMSLRPDASNPKAQHYPTSAQEQEGAMFTLAVTAHGDMTSAMIKKLAMN